MLAASDLFFSFLSSFHSFPTAASFFSLSPSLCLLNFSLYISFLIVSDSSSLTNITRSSFTLPILSSSIPSSNHSISLFISTCSYALINSLSFSFCVFLFDEHVLFFFSLSDGNVCHPTLSHPPPKHTQTGKLFTKLSLSFFLSLPFSVFCCAQLFLGTSLLSPLNASLIACSLSSCSLYSPCPLFLSLTHTFCLYEPLSYSLSLPCFFYTFLLLSSFLLRSFSLLLFFFLLLLLLLFPHLFFAV